MRPSPLESLRRLPLLALLALAGCGPLDATGRRCEVHPDCPVGMVCAAPSPEAARVCLPGFPQAGGSGGGGDGGTGGGVDGGVDGGVTPGTPDGGGSTPGGSAPTWCEDIQPLLERACAGCHTSPSSGGAPSTFRLDSYGELDGVPGAYSKALRIQARAVEQGSMPPSGSLGGEERALLGAWVAAGAPECGEVPEGDGGTLPPPELPEVVSFSTHVQPILSTFCVSCHSGGDPEGDLELTPGRARSQLLAESDCDNDYQRVVPGSPTQSLLWMVLSAHPDACAPPMPYRTEGLKTVSEFDFRVIERWIEQGAADN